MSPLESPLHARLLDNLRFRTISIFAAVVEFGGIIRAAKVLGIAQPSVSRTIREFEDLVGQRLFRKAGRRIVLSEAGETLYACVRTLLTDLRSAAEALDATDARGKVRVGILVAAAAELVPKAIILMRRRKPEVTITLFEASGDGLLSALAAGEVDMVVGRIFDAQLTNGFQHEVLYDEPILLCGRAGHPIFRRPKSAKLTIADIAQFPWIVPPTTVRTRFEIAAAIAGVPEHQPSRFVESMSVLANRALLLHTDMLAFLPRAVVAEDLALGQLATGALPFELNPSSIAITINTSRDLSATASSFISALREVSRNHLRKESTA